MLCPYCGYNGCSSHYHCDNCGSPGGMFHHYTYMRNKVGNTVYEGFRCKKVKHWRRKMKRALMRF